MTLENWLFNPGGLTPHGFCLSWEPGLIALHVASDVVIGLSYFSIPLAIAAFARRRPDMRYGAIAYLFVAFILACGATHFLAVLTLWVPAYGLEGLVKLVTAGLSMATAVVLWPLIPQLIRIPSSDQLSRLNAELEERVEQRTAELEASNVQLQALLREKTRVEEALRRSEEQFRVSFEAAVVGKVQSDPADGRIIRVNPAFARMLGHEPHELVGLDQDALSHPEDRAGDDPAFARLMSGEQDVYIREKRYLRRNGEAFWARISAAMVRSGPDAQPSLLVAVVEDIDARRQAEARLSDASRDREAALEERTHALAQRDLLLREVYHRVKNNLQVVDGLLVMQMRELADPAAKEAVARLRARVFALGLVHQQLMGSTNLETFSVSAFLSELVANIGAGGPSEEVSFTVSADPLHVGLDFGIPLGLLVTELVTNCLKHAFPGGRKGTIEVQLGRRQDGAIVLSVADDGVGYAPAEAAGARRSMGARIVEGLVRQLEGVMTVRREQGTRVEVRFAGAGL